MINKCMACPLGGIAYLGMKILVVLEQSRINLIVLQMCVHCLCQAVAVAMKDLMVVCNGYEVCEVVPNNISSKEGPAVELVLGIMYIGLYQAVARTKKDLLVVCNGYQIWKVMPSSCSRKERPACGL